jgi:Mrp family chromosome partitioning ATPase
VRPILSLIRLRRGRDGPMVLLVSSADRSEGRSSLAVALAASAAADGDRALVLDLEVDGHGAAEVMGLERSVADLADAAKDGWRLVPSLVRPMERPGLSLFAPAAGKPLPRQIFARRRTPGADDAGPGDLIDLLHLLRANSDLIVVDAPPVLTSDTCLRLAAQCDAVLVLFRTAHTREARLREAVGLLRRDGVEPFGLVQNDA